MKIGAAFPFRSLYKTNDDKSQILPVCYLKLNKEQESISSVFANYAVRGSRLCSEERQKLIEVVSRIIGNTKPSEKTFPPIQKLIVVVKQQLGIDDDSLEEQKKAEVVRLSDHRKRQQKPTDL